MKSMNRASGRVRQGFVGERAVVLPRPVVRQALRQPLLGDLLVTDVGYYPKANNHHVERSRGSEQLILILCERGCGWCQSPDGRTREVAAGELLVIPPKTPHTYGADRKQPWTIHWAHVDGRSTRDWAGELAGGEVRVRPGGGNADVSGLFEDLIKLLGSGYARARLLVAAGIAWRLLSRLATESSHCEKPVSGSKAWQAQLNPPARINAVVEYMRANLVRPVTVPELASRANLSASHFATVFRQTVGYPVLDYFVRLRMQRACELLDTTALPIKQVAAEVGYDDPLYFSRRFHKVHDQSPSKYRAVRKG